MSKKHEPYLNLFTSDWIADTRVLSPAARGIWIDILCYMKQSVITGVITTDITKLQRLLGVSYDSVRGLLAELLENNICDFEGEIDETFKLTSRRMVRDEAKKAAKSKAGKAGMKNRYKKKDNHVITNDITPVTPSVITNDITKPSISINNSNTREDNKGGTGEKEEEGKPMLKNEQIIDERTQLSLEDCKQYFLYSWQDRVKAARDVIAGPRQFYIYDPDIGTKELERLGRWVEAFNDNLRASTVISKQFGDWTKHFSHWLNKQQTTSEPQKQQVNGNNSNRQPQGGLQRQADRSASSRDILT